MWWFYGDGSYRELGGGSPSPCVKIGILTIISTFLAAKGHQIIVKYPSLVDLEQ